MGTLNKYILRQVAGAAFMTVGLFVFVLVLGNVMKEVVGDLAAGRLSVGFFLYIVALLIPGVIPYALPMGMLTGILLVFGRMSSQSEVVAIKACGRSIYSMAAPVFFIAIIASLFSVGINFNYAPIADRTYKSALRNLIRNNPLQFIQPGSFIRDFPGYVIYANGEDGKELTGFRYAFDTLDAADSFNCQRTRVCFHGHTHVPCIFLRAPGGDRSAIVKVGPSDGLLRQGTYFINVGSVGQPRDGDPRACYLIYTTEGLTKLSIEFRRVDYDIESAVRRIEEAGLPGRLITRLYTGQ